MAKDGVSKNKRGNYLIDKPFQINFIIRFLLVILITVLLSFVGFAIYYFQDSLLGISKLNQDIEIIKKGYSTISGFQGDSPVFEYVKGTKSYDNGEGTSIEEDDIILICKEIDGSGNVTYKEVFPPPYGSMSYRIGEEVKDIDPTKLIKKEGQVKKRTKMFYLIIGPLAIMCLTIMVIISIYSLFFSHRMAGPVYRMRVSLDRMLAGDLNFKIKVRNKDFFINLVDRLENLREKILNNSLKK